MALPIGLGSCEGGSVRNVHRATDEYSEVRVKRDVVPQEVCGQRGAKRKRGTCVPEFVSGGGRGGVDPLVDGRELWQNEELDSFMKEFKLN